MSIKELLKSNSNVQVVVSIADLKEFALELINENQKELETKPDEEYLSVDETSSMLQVKRTTLWRWNKTGYLCPIKVGGKPKYKKSDIKLILGG